MEIKTVILSKSQFELIIQDILIFLNEKRIKSVTTIYGWACNVEIDDLYQDIPISTDNLKQFLIENIENGVYEVGESDLFIENKETDVQFLLCHESDIHFTTKNMQLLQEVRDSWKRKGYI
ncbi:MAG: hypothetical protein AAF485_03145 [Chloroflexota bacterium]